MVKQLEQDGLAANAIHGNKSQGQRERALQEFRDGRAPILVATDIAARGIDVDDVTHVVQYDLPDVPESYVHRIGRTARAGASGEAVALVAPDEVDKLRAVEKLIRQAIPAEDQRQDKTAPLSRPQQGGGRARAASRSAAVTSGAAARFAGAGRPRSIRDSLHRAPFGGGGRDGHRAGASGGDASRRREAAPAEAADAPSRGDRQAWRDADFRDGVTEPRDGGGAGTGQAAR